jgi:hypothetical protein
MQMRERKYIRFDFTQALHARATSVERRDYRIIARTWTSDRSSTKRLRTLFTLLRQRIGFAREACAQRPKRVHSSPAFPIYRADLHDSRELVQKQDVALVQQLLRASRNPRTESIRRDKRIKSKRRACASRSNFSWWIA